MMPEKGARLDWPGIAVLPPSPALGRVMRIGTAQYSIIVNPGGQGRWHWSHTPPIIGRQCSGTHHGGGPWQRGFVQPPLAGHTHWGEERIKKNDSFRVRVLFIQFILIWLAWLKVLRSPRQIIGCLFVDLLIHSCSYTNCINKREYCILLKFQGTAKLIVHIVHSLIYFIIIRFLLLNWQHIITHWSL